MRNNVVVKGGISLNVLVFIVFLVLKLAGIGTVATWSWWWITAPLWGGTAIVLLLILILFIIGFIGAMTEGFFH